VAIDSYRADKCAYLSRLDFNSSHQISSLPVKHANTPLALDTQKYTTSETLGLETDIQTSTLLFEVLEDLYTGGSRMA
jgi:hypothetical protein